MHTTSDALFSKALTASMAARVPSMVALLRTYHPVEREGVVRDAERFLKIRMGNQYNVSSFSDCYSAGRVCWINIEIYTSVLGTTPCTTRNTCLVEHQEPPSTFTLHCTHRGAPGNRPSTLPRPPSLPLTALSLPPARHHPPAAARIRRHPPPAAVSAPPRQQAPSG